MPVTKTVGIAIDFHPVETDAEFAPIVTPFVDMFPVPPVPGITPGQPPLIQGIQSGKLSATKNAVGVAFLCQIPSGVVPTGSSSLSGRMTFLADHEGESPNDTLAFATGTSATNFTSYGSITIDDDEQEYVSNSVALADDQVGLGVTYVTPTINPGETDPQGGSVVTLVWGFCAELTYTPPPPVIQSIAVALLEPTAAIIEAVIKTYEVVGTTYITYVSVGDDTPSLSGATSIFGTTPPEISFPANEEVLAQYQLAGLSPGGTYEVTVFVTTESGSDSMNNFSFTTPTTPVVPTLVF